MVFFWYGVHRRWGTQNVGYPRHPRGSPEEQSRVRETRSAPEVRSRAFGGARQPGPGRDCARAIASGIESGG